MNIHRFTNTYSTFDVDTSNQTMISELNMNFNIFLTLDQPNFTVVEDGVLNVSEKEGILNSVANATSIAAIEGIEEAVNNAYQLYSGAELTINEDGSFVFDTKDAYIGLVEGQSVIESIKYRVRLENGEIQEFTLKIKIDGKEDAGQSNFSQMFNEGGIDSVPNILDINRSHGFGDKNAGYDLDGLGNRGAADNDLFTPPPVPIDTRPITPLIQLPPLSGSALRANPGENNPRIAQINIFEQGANYNFNGESIPEPFDFSLQLLERQAVTIEHILENAAAIGFTDPGGISNFYPTPFQPMTTLETLPDGTQIVTTPEGNTLTLYRTNMNGFEPGDLVYELNNPVPHIPGLPRLMVPGLPQVSMFHDPSMGMVYDDPVLGQTFVDPFLYWLVDIDFDVTVGSLTELIADDMPYATDLEATIDEADIILTGSNDTVIPAVIMGSLVDGVNVGFGGDGGIVTNVFIDNGVTVIDPMNNLITVTTEEGNVLEIQQTTGDWTYTLNNPIDNDSDTNATDTEGLDIFGFELTDFDFDQVTAELVITILDDTTFSKDQGEDIDEADIITIGSNGSGMPATVSGILIDDIDTEFGADGGIVNDVTIDNGSTVIDSKAMIITVTTEEGNVLVVDQNSGEWTYTLNNPIDNDSDTNATDTQGFDIFEYELLDNDSDSSKAKLVLTVEDDTSILADNNNDVNETLLFVNGSETTSGFLFQDEGNGPDIPGADGIFVISVNGVEDGGKKDLDGKVNGSITATTEYGEITVDTSTSEYTYTLINAKFEPDAQGIVNDDISYSTSDGDGDIFNAGLTVAVDLNQAPIAVPDNFAPSSEDTIVTGNLLTNDIDPDAPLDKLTVTSVNTSGTVGKLTVDPQGNFTYNPTVNLTSLPTGVVFVDTFGYTVTDAEGLSSTTSTNSFTVVGVNDAPQANDDFVFTSVVAPLNINVLANDTDPDSNDNPGNFILTSTGISAATINGVPVPLSTATATVSGNQVLFDPGTDFNSIVPTDTVIISIPYQMSDNEGLPSLAVATVVINGATGGGGGGSVTAVTDPFTFEANEPVINLIIVADLSGSMLNEVANNFSRFERLETAIAGDGGVIDQFDQISSDLNIHVIPFAAFSFTQSFTGGNAALLSKNFISELKPDIDAGDGTNYATGMQQAINLMNSAIIDPFATNVLYFLSDGAPDDDAARDALLPSWQVALNNNNVDAIAVNLNDDASTNTELAGLDNPGDSVVDPDDDLSNLDAVLEVQQVLTGNVLGNDIGSNLVVTGLFGLGGTGMFFPVNSPTGNAEALIQPNGDFIYRAPLSDFNTIASNNFDYVVQSLDSPFDSDVGTIAVTYTPLSPPAAPPKVGANGFWTLTVVDDFAGSNGEIFDWDLNFLTGGVGSFYTNSSGLALPSVGTVSQSIFVSGVNPAWDNLELQLNFEHDDIDDIQVFLTAPDGTTVPIFTNAYQLDQGEPPVSVSGNFIFNDLDGTVRFGSDNSDQPTPFPGPPVEYQTELGYGLKTLAGVAPVAVDLDGDGLELTSVTNGVSFDIDNDGAKEQMSWVGADDGLLVFDYNSDGKVTEAKEFVFTLHDENAKTDLEAIRNVFDTNQDGLLDAQDDAWENFAIWQDKNQDAMTQDGELFSLDDLGYESLVLNSDNIEQILSGNLVHGGTVLMHESGNNIDAYDVTLNYADVLDINQTQDDILSDTLSSDGGQTNEIASVGQAPVAYQPDQMIEAQIQIQISSESEM